MGLQLRLGGRVFKVEMALCTRRFLKNHNGNFHFQRSTGWEVVWLVSVGYWG